MERTLCVTIDTEPDCDVHWRRSNPLSFDSVLYGIGTFLRPIWDRYDIKPVYFISPEVVRNDDCCRVLREEIQSGAEIGAHLHPEYIEPELRHETAAGTTSREYPCFAYSTETECAKIRNFTDLIERTLGVRPVSYRAASYGADLDTIKCLEKLDYQVDSSVTPDIDWSNQGGPNHSNAPKQPYFISAEDYYTPGSSKMLEVPVTISKKRFSLLPPKWYFYKWLRPTLMSVIEMKFLTKLFMKEHTEPVLNMMFNSMEILPGRTPFVRNKAQQKMYLTRLGSIIRYLREDVCFESRTLRELYEKKVQEKP